MRTRESVEGSLSESTLQMYVSAGGSPPAPLFSTHAGSIKRKTIIDTVTPNFTALKKCGKFLPINPVEISTLTERHLRSSVSLFDGTGIGYQYSGDWWGMNYAGIGNSEWTLDFELTSPDLVDIAVLSAASKAATGYWDVLTALGELRETASLLYTLGSQFNKATMRAAKHAREFKRNPWKKFQEIWLGYRYGVRPLIYDIEDAYVAIQKYGEELNYIIGRSRQRTDVVAEYDSGWQTLPGARWSVVEKRTGDAFAFGWAAHAVKSRFRRSFQLDPVVTAWELVPYSFVVDRFINIGDYVNTIVPQLSGAYEGISGSTKIVQTLSRVYTLQATNPGSSGSIIGRSERKIEKYVRGPASVPFPPVNLRLDWAFAVDLATLFIKGRQDVNRMLSSR